MKTLPFGMDGHLTDEQHARNFLRRFEQDFKINKFPVEYEGIPIESGSTVTRPSVGLKFKVRKGRMCEVSQHGRILYSGPIRNFNPKLAYMEME